ncbi:MAG: hypothetical protein ACRYG7_43540 [Janthinobacterium lividum]
MEGFWQAVHRAFYAHLPQEFRWVKTQEGEQLEVLPSELWTSEVRVGRHVAPAASALPAFIERIEWGCLTGWRALWLSERRTTG